MESGAFICVQRGSIRLKRIKKLAEGGAVYPDSHGLTGKQYEVCTYLM